MVIELSERGLVVQVQKPIEVRFRGQAVGHFDADLVVNDIVIVELKSVRLPVPVNPVDPV
jgi:GxxExxY protein